MARRRTLIPTPLAWPPRAEPVPHPPLPVLAERGGTQLRTPLPVAIIDTREQNPLSFRRFRGWFAGIEERALPLGDYSVSGMENTCVVERKDLADLICSFHLKPFGIHPAPAPHERSSAQSAGNHRVVKRD